MAFIMDGDRGVTAAERREICSPRRKPWVDSAVAKYIEEQETHHHKRTFQEEFVELLVKHGIDYDPKFVFG